MLIVDMFIDDIPEKLLKKWKEKMVKETIKDFLADVDSSYVIKDGYLTWADSDVEDWQKVFFCNKIVKFYKKMYGIKDPIQLSIVDTGLECFIEKTCKAEHDGFYETSLDTLMNRYPDVQADEPLEAQLSAILDAQKSLTIKTTF